MNKTRTILAATVAAFAISGSAMASDSTFTVVSNNWQYNRSTVFAHATFQGFNIGGDFKASTVAIGNNWISETDGSTRLLTQQTQWADLGATTKGTLTNVGGDIEMSAATICNNASVTVRQAAITSIDNVQRCNTIDPFSVVGLYANGVGGDIDLSATTIANNISIDAGSAGAFFRNEQVSPSEVYASVAVDLSNVNGNVGMNVAAVANNATFRSRFNPGN